MRGSEAASPAANAAGRHLEGPPASTSSSSPAYCWSRTRRTASSRCSSSSRTGIPSDTGTVEDAAGGSAIEQGGVGRLDHLVDDREPLVEGQERRLHRV